MKPIKYFLFFVTALCVSQWNNFGKEPQRGFGPRIPNNKLDSSFPNNLNKDLIQVSQIIQTRGLVQDSQINKMLQNSQIIQWKKHVLNTQNNLQKLKFKFFVLWILMDNIYNYLIKT